jgi:hypothetical protein
LVRSALAVAVIATLADVAPPPRPVVDGDAGSKVVAVGVQTSAGRATLSDADALSVAALLQASVQNCSFNSIDDPEVFRKLDPAQAWLDRAARPHIAAHFPAGFDIQLLSGARRRGTDLLIPHRPDYWLVRDGATVLILTKCSGTASVALDCSPALRPHFQPDAALCRAFEESHGPRPRPRP